MRALGAFSVILALLCGIVAAHDSEGTKFVFTFARNFKPNGTDTNLSVTIINGNKTNVTASIVYYMNPFDISTTNNTIVTVLQNSAMEVALPHILAWDFVNGGFTMEADTRVFITTSDKVTILANNYITNGKGDTFIVLPTEYVSGSAVRGTYNYAVSIPIPSDPLDGYPQFTIFNFIPLVGDTTVTVHSNDDVESVKNITLKFKRGQKQNYYTVGNGIRNDPVIYATGNRPFSILATITCAITADQKDCDHASFMPHPIAYTTCTKEPIMHDHHITDLYNSQRFYIAPPSRFCPMSDIIASVTSNNTVLSADRVPINSARANAYQYPAGDFGDFADLLSETGLMSVARIGGLTSSKKGGIFIDAVPSITQFINESSSFYTRYPGDRVQLFVDAVAYILLELDGQKVTDYNQTNLLYIKVHDTRYYQFVITLSTTGYHKFKVAYSGAYVYYVTGNPHFGSAYGYLGGFKRQTPQWIDLTTVGPTSPTTSTTVGPTSPTTSTTVGPTSTTTGSTTTIIGSNITMSTSTGPEGSSSTTPSHRTIPQFEVTTRGSFLISTVTSSIIAVACLL